MNEKIHPKKIEQIEEKYRAFLAATSLSEDRKEHTSLTRSYGRNNAFLTWSHQPFQEAIEAIGKLNPKVSSKAIGKVLSSSMIKLFVTQAVREDADPEVEAHLDSILPILDDSAISEKVNEILDDLLSLVGVRTVLVPVEGISLKRMSKLSIGEAILHRSDFGPLRALLDGAEIRPVAQDDIRKGIGNIGCYALVEAEGERVFAEQEALRKVEDVTHILNLGLAYSYSRSRGYRKIRPQRQIGSSPEQYQLILHADSAVEQLDPDPAKWTIAENSPVGHNYEICPEDLQKWQGLGMDKVVACFVSDNADGSIASKIRQSTVWYSRAMSADSSEERFVAVAIALESLLVSQGEGGSSPSIAWGSIGQRLADRVAFLIRKSWDERIEIAQQAKELYSMRSKIVHAGEPISWDNLYRLEFMFKSAFWAFVGLVEDKITSWDDFLKWEQRLKYSGGEQADDQGISS